MSNLAQPSSYVPERGDIFYIAMRPWERINHNPFSDVATKSMQQDNSYRGDLFQCIGSDSHAVVGVRKHGFMSSADTKYIFTRDQCYFYPVGPEVKEALQLEHKQEDPTSTVDFAKYRKAGDA